MHDYIGIISIAFVIAYFGISYSVVMVLQLLRRCWDDERAGVQKRVQKPNVHADSKN